MQLQRNLQIHDNALPAVVKYKPGNFAGKQPARLIAAAHGSNSTKSERRQKTSICKFRWYQTQCPGNVPDNNKSSNSACLQSYARQTYYLNFTGTEVNSTLLATARQQ